MTPSLSAPTNPPSLAALTGPARPGSALELLEARYGELEICVEQRLRSYRIHNAAELAQAESYLRKISRFQEAGHTILTGRPLSVVSYASTDRSECYPTLGEHLAWQSVWQRLGAAQSNFTFAAFVRPPNPPRTESTIDQLVIDRGAVDSLIASNLPRFESSDRRHLSGHAVVNLLCAGGVLNVEQRYGGVFTGLLFGIGPQNAAVYERIRQLSAKPFVPGERRTARGDAEPSPGFLDAQSELNALSDSHVWGSIAHLDGRLSGAGPQVSFMVHRGLPETAKLCQLYGSAAEKIRDFDRRGMLTTLLWSRLLSLTEIPPHGTSFL